MVDIRYYAHAQLQGEISLHVIVNNESNVKDRMGKIICRLVNRGYCFCNKKIY